MDWDNLLEPRRLGKDSVDSGDALSAYQEDTGNIIFETAFRRLQGKAQVHPFPKLDYLRTRLTHTTEVAHVGRILASKIASRTDLRFKGEKAGPIVSEIVFAACLGHDLGNPPFGHVGEYAIRTWFDDQFEGALKDAPITQDQRNDLSKFDGNAQGFRILTRLAGRPKLQRETRLSGLRLCYPVLGAFSKYPFGSSDPRSNKKKFGYMVEDENTAVEVFSKLGMGSKADGFVRHPLAYVVEAADDICYLTSDLDDAARTDTLPFKTAEDRLLSIASAGGLSSDYAEYRTRSISERERLKYLRGAAVASLIDAAVDVFQQHENDILSGQFNSALLERSKFGGEIADITKLCKESIYLEQNKVEIESAGYHAICGMLEIFGDMIADRLANGEKLTKRNLGTYHVLSEDFRDRIGAGSQYSAYLTLVDYISGMTDRYILDLYQKLTGVGVSLGRMASN